MVTKEKLKEIIALGNYTLSQKGNIAYINSQVGKDFRDALLEINRSIDRSLMITSFITTQDKDGTLTIDGVTIYDYGSILIKNAEWTITSTPDGSNQVYRVYIEDIPELNSILQYLDGDKKHSIWFEVDNNNTNSVTHFKSYLGDYCKHLEKLESAGLLDFVQCSTINPYYIIRR